MNNSTEAGMHTFNDLKNKFGAYKQVFEDNDPTNITKARSIALNSTKNTDPTLLYVTNHRKEDIETTIE